MTERRTKLRILDGLDAPSLWSDIEARQARPDPSLDPSLWRRRLGTVALAIAVGLAGVLVAVKALGPAAHPTASLDTRTWSSHDVPTLHLRFNHPPQWHVQPFDELVGRAGMIGSVVSNVDHRFRHPDLGPNRHTSAWEMRGMPDDAVVISIQHLEAIGPPQPDSVRPLEIDRAERSVGEYLDPGWVQLWLPFTLAGVDDSVFIWFGPEATAHDREVARLIVASIGPIPT